MSKLEVKNLYKVFGKKPYEAFDLLEKGKNREEIKEETGQVVALQDINFSVKESETFVLMGLSGSGKSTLLRCINRLIEPTRGEIWVDGKDGGKMEERINVVCADKEELRYLRRQEFGMVFQHFALFPHKNVIENATYGLEIQGTNKKERRKKAQEMLELVGLEGWEKAKPSQLSGGMKQRVGLARALAIDPEVLLLDEPFSGLDPLIKREMQDELIKLQNKVKKTMIFVTHDLDEAVKVGDHIGIINKNGRMVQIGTPKEVLKNPADEYVEAFVEDIHKYEEELEKDEI